MIYELVCHSMHDMRMLQARPGWRLHPGQAAERAHAAELAQLHQKPPSRWPPELQCLLEQREAAAAEVPLRIWHHIMARNRQLRLSDDMRAWGHSCGLKYLHAMQNNSARSIKCPGQPGSAGSYTYTKPCVSWRLGMDA